MDKRYGHLQLMDLLKSVFVAAVDGVDGELVSSQSIDLVVLTQLNVFDVPSNIVLPNFLSVEIEEGNLRIGLGGFPK